MPRIVYEIEEPWSVAISGMPYASKIGEPAREWKATIDAWPESVGNNIRLADFSSLTLEGNATHIINMLHSMLEQLEMIEADYLEDKTVVRVKTKAKPKRRKR